MRSAHHLAGLAAATLALLLAPTSARANGDETLGESLRESGKGYGLASTGVGMAGRREVAANTTPVPSGILDLTGVPAGALVRHAYLYWAVFGKNGDATVTFANTTTTGTVIGTSAPT